MISIDDAIAFEKRKAEERREKVRKKAKQNFKDKAVCLHRWIEEANYHEQIANLLIRLKNYESL